MERYKNLSGNSGVYSYEIGTADIKVRFNDGAIYKYTNVSAGYSNIEQMKRLAFAGIGLNSFISTTVKKKYSAKLR